MTLWRTKCVPFAPTNGIIRHEHTLVGMNGRFDTIQAAVLLAKLPHFEWEIAERQRLGTRYSELLSDVCVTPAIAPGDTHVYAQYTIRLPDRDAVATKPKAAGIPTAVFYPKCLHEQSVFARLATVGGRSQWLSKLRARFSASPCIRFLERPTSIGSPPQSDLQSNPERYASELPAKRFPTASLVRRMRAKAASG